MSVSIALHDRADGDLRPDVLLHGTKVVAQSGKRDLRPIRPALDARRCERSRQDFDNTARQAVVPTSATRVSYVGVTVAVPCRRKRSCRRDKAGLTGNL